MLIDLHVHSTYSDGILTPTKIIKFLLDNNVEVAALTDHNTVGGLDEFCEAGEKMGLKTISGMELYVRLGNRKFNLLWYNFDYKNLELHKLLKETQVRRRKEVRKKLCELKDKGYKIEVDELLDKCLRYLAINKIGKVFYKTNKKRIDRELKINKFAEEDVLKEYFFNKKTGKLKESYIDIKRVMKLKEKIGGQLIFCHPGKNNKYAGTLPEKLAKLGIDGIETLSPHHSPGAIKYCQLLARKYNWIETGGSDLHSPFGDRYFTKYPRGRLKIDDKGLKGIKKIIKQK
jgi:predicted metal-dependent phosphoesterase TrpH